MATTLEESKQDLKTDELKLSAEHTLPSATLGLDASTDGKRLYAACLDGGIYDLDSETGEHIQIGKHDSYASGAALVPNKPVLISAGYDGVIQWHDLISHETYCVVKAHDFWSWRIAVSPNGRHVASVSGQYLCGGYEYQPANEKDPSIKVFDVETTELIHSFSHRPPVLSVAISPDSQYLAAGNLMGDVRVWDLDSGRQVSEWNTPDFTSWGIIKSHHYIGGIFDAQFTHDGNDLLLCGMGPMRDPMAGNGKQTWQRFSWRDTPSTKTAEVKDDERGRGLMETLAIHPNGDRFVMAGRMTQGNWNMALFSSQTGSVLQTIDNKGRNTKAVFSADGARLFLAGAKSQKAKQDGQWPDFGRIMVYSL